VCQHGYAIYPLLRVAENFFGQPAQVRLHSPDAFNPEQVDVVSQSAMKPSGFSYEIVGKIELGGRGFDREIRNVQAPELELCNLDVPKMNRDFEYGCPTNVASNVQIADKLVKWK
jgi:hypothetical protein